MTNLTSPSPPASPGFSARARAVAGSTLGRSALQGSWAMADQATVSAANFLTTVVIGRLAGPEELGLYSMAFSAVVWILAFQETLVSLPYTVLSARLTPAARTLYAGSSLVHTAGLAMVASIGLALAWLGSTLVVGWQPAAGMLSVLAIIVPVLLLRDFIRRLLFAHLEHSSAARLDIVVTALQLSGLGMVAWAGSMSARSAWVVVGLSSGAVGAIWLFAHRRLLEARRDAVREDWRRNWTFGRWGFASRILGNINSDITMVWVVAALLGTQATGVFAACMAIVAFSNPFVIGMSLYLTPAICQAFVDRDDAARRRVVAWVTLVMGACMGAFCVAAWLYGDAVMVTVYGAGYEGYHATVTVLAATVFATVLAHGPGTALLALDRPELNFRASVAGMVVTVPAVAVLAVPLGPTGVAWGLLLGHLADSGLRAGMFLWLTGGGTWRYADADGLRNN
jgi:O-antigen/teichoic acid export membrane protein